MKNAKRQIVKKNLIEFDLILKTNSVEDSRIIWHTKVRAIVGLFSSDLGTNMAWNVAKIRQIETVMEKNSQVKGSIGKMGANDWGSGSGLATKKQTCKQ